MATIIDTPEVMATFAGRLNLLANEFTDVLPGDYQLERILNGIAMLMDEDAANERDPLVVACIRSAAESARHAAMDYYASFK